MDNFACIAPSWHQMHDYAKKTADAIKKSGFYPDTIIALSRGGLVPGRLLADFLHIKNVLAIKVDHWGITATKDGNARISHGLSADLSGNRVLIVDDITDTGQSMELALRHVKELSPKEAKTATLIHLVGSKYVPDFYGYKREWAWIIFPWNYREDLVNLILKISKEGKREVAEIKEKLKTSFKVDAGIEEVKEVLEHIEYLENANK